MQLTISIKIHWSKGVQYQLLPAESAESQWEQEQWMLHVTGTFPGLLGSKTSLILILDDISLNMWHQEQTDCAVFKYSFQFFFWKHILHLL